MEKGCPGYWKWTIDLYKQLVFHFHVSESEGRCWGERCFEKETLASLELLMNMQKTWKLLWRPLLGLQVIIYLMVVGPQSG